MELLDEITLNTSSDLLALDIGSTTAKLVLIRGGKVVYARYERHFSQVRRKALDLVRSCADFIGDAPLKVAVSGSAGLGLADAAGLPFVQEVFATGEVMHTLSPGTGTVIELGGEDAKIIFFPEKGTPDERMNGSCAGGTGAFIDQMATLLDVTPTELDEMSLQAERIYPIASRCGVFAKSDIQPLLNQGAKKSDLAASIYQAVVNQTIAGLARGTRIRGRVAFLGGPLYYDKGLRKRFQETLSLSDEDAVFPAYALYAVALGAALYADGHAEPCTYQALLDSLENASASAPSVDRLPPLFSSQEDYDAFAARHAKAQVETTDIEAYSGDAYLGIDCGSTTTKLVLLSADRKILYTYYRSNLGNPVEVVRGQLNTLFALCGNRIRIVSSAVTGYGEDLIRHAFGVEFGLVETIAHYTAARFFCPEVDFILDIGGQDIKCFRVHNNAIDSIMLNEACSSGCGSFLETFAKSMGFTIADFAKRGLLAKSPVDLGSRCTVFMNSSVKQAQKDGAEVGDISAGLSISVVRNAIYKVIRANSASELGAHIVVQGGTVQNDAVLRALEREVGAEVIRPSIAGLMGAYGAALHARDHAVAGNPSTLITPEKLAVFTHTAKAATCHGCANACRLTINSFPDGKKFVSGNQCDKGAGIVRPEGEEPANLYELKRQKLSRLQPQGDGIAIGLPLSLGMYELAPFWYTLFTDLGFRAVFSGLSDKHIYQLGQFSIPSDTACYPAKLMHGHIQKLIDDGIRHIFYPCLSYNMNEGQGQNHYNCPVVAYYSELLYGNTDALHQVDFLYPYLNLSDPRQLTKELYSCLHPVFSNLTKKQIAHAVEAAQNAYDTWMSDIRSEGKRILSEARAKKQRIMILAGRPYHIDPEVGHGIDKLATSLGFAVVTEDAVSDLAHAEDVRVLNQWTYHARLYNAAAYAAECDDVSLVQLVSFGCGIDAITTDEVRRILETSDKLYTQIKIDEITNLGAVRIRLRSLLGALEERGRKA